VLAALAVASTMQLEHWRDCERLFARALAVTRGNYVANQTLGALRMRRGDIEGALPPLAEAVRLKPHWADARGLLADALAAQGRLELAVMNYGEAVGDKPRDVSLRMRFGQALVKRGWHDEALNQYGVALGLDAKEKGLEAARIHTLIGLAWSARGDAAQAVAHYEQALAIDPELAEARVNLALARLVSGDAAAAAENLRAALAAGADQPEVHLGLADALRQLGRDREAIEQYRAALVAWPESAQAANDLSWLLATTGDPALRDPPEALRWAARAAEASGRRDAAILDTLAVCQAAAGRTDDAHATLAEALTLAEAAGNTALAADLRARLK
jgi:Tfp pilus assembly protein PilF